MCPPDRHRCGAEVSAALGPPVQKQEAVPLSSFLQKREQSDGLEPSGRPNAPTQMEVLVHKIAEWRWSRPEMEEPLPYRNWIYQDPCPYSQDNLAMRLEWWRYELNRFYGQFCVTKADPRQINQIMEKYAGDEHHLFVAVYA